MRNALLPVLARARALEDYNGQKWQTYYWRKSRWPAGCAVGLWRVWVKEGEVVDIVAGGIHSGYVVKWKGAVDDADGELETPSAAAANDAVKLALWLRAREQSSAAQHAVVSTSTWASSMGRCMSARHESLQLYKRDHHEISTVLFHYRSDILTALTARFLLGFLRSGLWLWGRSPAWISSGSAAGEYCSACARRGLGRGVGEPGGAFGWGGAADRRVWRRKAGGMSKARRPLRSLQQQKIVP